MPTRPSTDTRLAHPGSRSIGADQPSAADASSALGRAHRGPLHATADPTHAPGPPHVDERGVLHQPSSAGHRMRGEGRVEARPLEAPGRALPAGVVVPDVDGIVAADHAHPVERQGVGLPRVVGQADAAAAPRGSADWRTRRMPSASGARATRSAARHGRARRAPPPRPSPPAPRRRPGPRRSRAAAVIGRPS